MRRILPAFAALLFALPSTAQIFGDPNAHKPHVEWGVDFQYYFNNSEYDRSSNLWDPSQTVNAVRLTPRASLVLPQTRAEAFRNSNRITHRVNLGLDIFRNFGEGLPFKECFKEITAWYSLDAYFSNKGHFEAAAGCFPRSFTEGRYTGLIYDAQTLFLDPNIEGMWFKFHSRRFFGEIGLDWMGMFGDSENPTRRERFRVLTSGRWRFAGQFFLGWDGSLYHFACSPAQPNVVDNHIVNPWIEWSPKSALDLLSIDAGPVFSYQWDRNFEADPRALWAFHSRQRIQKWGLGIDNRFYYGADLAPLWGSYGSELYNLEQCYHTRAGGNSWCDSASIYYRPRIGNCAELEISVRFLFGAEIAGAPVFRGCEQMATIRIIL